MSTSRILIVDDMPDSIPLLPEWLQREGYRTYIATGGQQALAMAEEVRPDAILLDTVMPSMGGIETCRRLRMNPATADIPVILMSARDPSEARAESLLAGATDHVTKPIHFPDLLERLERIVHFKENAYPSHHRLLDEMAYTALTVLPCNLSWLLTVDNDNRWLVDQSIAMDRGVEAAQRFLSLIHTRPGDIRFPLVAGNNPLAEAILSRTVLINIPILDFYKLPGGAIFRRAFAEFRFAYISLLPLVIGGRAVGILVLATIGARIGTTQQEHQLLNSLSSQAAMVIDNARLLLDLAAHERHMQAEQAFRQMVLDTMGEGLVVVDQAAKIIYVNNRLLLMTGYTREELYGQSIGLIFHPSYRDKVVDSLTKQGRHTLPFSQQIYTRNGKVMPVLLSRVVAPSPGGKGQSTIMVVTDVSELQRQEEALKLQSQRLQAINWAANAISSARSFDEVIMTSLQSALQVVQGVSAVILLRDSDHPDILVQAGFVGPHAHSATQSLFSVGEGLAGWVASSSDSQLVRDIPQDDIFVTQYIGLRASDIVSVVAVPLISSDNVIGVLEVINKHEGAFDDQDLRTLESLAGSVAIAIENARLFDQMRRRVSELSTLLDASAALSSTLDFGDLLERIARRLSVALNVERVLIMSWDRQAKRLETLAEVVSAYWPPGTGPVRPFVQIPISQAVFESGKAVIVSDAIEPGVTWNEPEMVPSGLQTVAAFPISMGEGVVGVLALQSELAPGNFFAIPVEKVERVIAQWQEQVRSQDPISWIFPKNLSDLAHRVLDASGLRWCSFLYWDRVRNEVRVVCEIGRALWLDRLGQTWDVRRYPTLAHVLDTGNALTLQLDQLKADPDEQAYLRSVGGNTCLIAPLFIRGESSGLVKLVDCKPEARMFDNAELSLCQGIANVVANTMENAQLYSAQEQRASALEAAYVELQDADRAKDDLLQNLSHELRTPLTHILGYLSLVTDGAFGALNPELAEVVQLISDKAQHLADLVKDILNVQGPEARSREFKPFNLEQVVALSIRSISGQAQAQQIRIAMEVSPGLPIAYGDPVQIGEVFEELLENAIKFSPNATVIEVRLEDPGGPMLHASVRDYGIGIPPSEHEKIFRRFYQVESGTTRRFGGTGLGLSIVRRVVEDHNGRVWVESELGQGSCFHLTLPKASTIESDL